MELDRLIKNACEDWSAKAQMPVGLADLALRGRSRRRAVKAALAAALAAFLTGAAVVVGSTVATPIAERQPTQPPTPQLAFQPVALSADTAVRTDLGSTFPRRLVAAGHVAVAAYHTDRLRASAGGAKTVESTWYLYNPTSGTYEETPWANLDVAPGMHQAAVLEGPLPTSRVGLLDMKTQKVTRWISVEHPVGGVSWSPNGRRLIMTAYARNPYTIPAPGPCLLSGSVDAASRAGHGDIKPCGPDHASSRLGYYIVDESGDTTFHALPPDPANGNLPQDLGWSRDGTLIWAPTATAPTKVFYTPDGEQRPAPAHEADDAEPAGLSPNGTLLPKFGPRPGPAVTVRNVTTGKVVAVLPIEGAEAWADDHQLFAVGCDPKRCKGTGEFHNRLLLVNLKGEIKPLTGYHRSDREGSWVPLFTHR
ncbi:hypothetical protein [Planotetraspora kaengkrachanensis]|uniref:WD40 repeat protein n=1 Tax=Planotetraspora kaengkrachanensis TaxID=575193 RepID=A0A8J3PR82_9ACTN|nr:hypothetical protein [Planotetraspora kaengkrachanensis]GIG79546.1 hypothetical protein Pka01_26730 [Planotetraspora kaengkrachanensis]